MDEGAKTGKKTGVWIITSAHSCEDGRLYYKEGLSLKKAGYDLTITVPGDRTEKIITDDKIKVIKIKRNKGLIGRIRFNLSLLRTAFNADYMVSHCVEPDTLFIGILLKILQRKKIVYDCHEHTPSFIAVNRKFPRPFRRFFAALVWLIERMLIIPVDEIIDTNETRAARFMRVKPKHTTVVSNMPNVEYIQNVMRCSTKEKSETKNDFVIVSTGDFNKNRGFHIIVEAIRLLRERYPARCFRFVGIGRLDEREQELKSWSDDFLQRHNLKENIEITGWLPYDEMYEKVACADVGIIMFQPDSYNHFSGLPNKLFDFMCVGIPVVASDLPEIRNVVSSAGCGLLVDPKNSSSVADVIYQLSMEADLQREMGERGRSAVLNKYNWEQMEKRLLCVYERLFERE
ncbi:MAG: glycosyltransferase family 4 protein [bacterium]